MSLTDRSRGSFTYEELDFASFHNSARVRDFCCGDKDLDDFLNTEEVAEYERERFGKTWLVFIQGDVVAYYTVAPGSLHTDHIKVGQKSFQTKRNVKIEEYPALKLGRFAVRQDLQRKGLGTLLMDHIKGLALTWEFPCRLIILNAASDDAIKFYHSCGFVLSKAHRQRNRIQKIMFYDLEVIRDIAYSAVDGSEATHPTL